MNNKRFFFSLLALVTIAMGVRAANVSLTPDGSGGYYVNMVKNTTSTLTLDGTVTSFKVYDDGGENEDMSTGSHTDYLVIHAPQGYKLQLTGYMRAAAGTKLTVYDGSNKNAAVLVGPISNNGYVSVRATSTGEDMMLYLDDWYASSGYEGIYLTVTLLLDEKKTPLTFEAVEAGTVSIVNPLGLTIEYNKNGGSWTSANTNPINIDVAASDKVQFRGDNSCYWGTGAGGETPTRFTTTGRCYVYGNVMSLVHASDFPTNNALTDEFALAYLFAAPTDNPYRFYSDNTTILSHGENNLALPATSVPGSGYAYMFAGCKGLTRTPQLPATTLGLGCYHQMFADCTGLTSVTELPAETLSTMCYSNMFTNCSSLTEAPSLPATTLVEGCYFGMFEGCTSLVETPQLFAETLATDSYAYMFNGCSSLNKVSCFATDLSAERCTQEWLSGVAATGTFVKPADVTDWTLGSSGIPEGWTADNRSLTAYAILCTSNNTLYFRCSYDDIAQYGSFVPESGGEALTASYLWKDQQVVGHRYGDVRPQWCGNSYKSYIKTVVFEPSFKAARPVNLYGYFYYCHNLTTIIGWENFNTSEATQTMNMFALCQKLTEVDVSHFNMGKVTRTYGMFEYCSQLTTIRGIENLNTSTVESMGYMFAYCPRLLTLDLSAWDVSKVVGMANMFCGCTALQSVNVSNWDTSSVTDMSYMFQNCNNLETLDVSHFDTHNVGSMSYMFQNCAKLTTIDVSDFNTQNVIQMDNMFSGCSAVTTLDVSGFDTEKVTHFSAMFNRCGNVETLDVSKFKTSSAQHMLNMFQNCAKIKTLNLGKFYTSNVGSMSGMFSGCAALESIYVSNLWSTANAASSDNMFAGCTALVGEDGTTYDAAAIDKTRAHYNAGGYLRHTTDVQFGTQPYVVWDSNAHVLYMMQSDATLTADTPINDLPEGTTVTGIWYGDVVTDPRETYYPPLWNSASLNDVYVQGDVQRVVIMPSFSSVPLKSLRSWFNYFRNMTAIEGLEYLNTSQVTDMNQMFAGCKKLQTLDITALDVSNVTNMSEAFEGCEALTEIDVTGWNTGKVTNFFRTFNYCPALTTIKGIEDWDTSSATDMFETFGSCYALQRLDLSGWNTANVMSFKWLFNGNTNLKAVFVGNGWSTDAATETSGMFYDCTSIVGEDGTTFDSSVTDATNAHYNAGGYLRKKHDSWTVTIPMSGISTFSADWNVSIPDGLTAHYCTDFDTENSSMCVANVSGGIIPAETGVLLKGTPGESYTLQTTTDEAPIVTGNALVAVTVPTHVEPTDGEYTNLMLKSGEFIRIAEDDESVMMPANRAYLQITTAALSTQQAISLYWGDATSVLGREPRGLNTGAPIYYDLQGQRVEHPVRGIYIQRTNEGNKKVIIK